MTTTFLDNGICTFKIDFRDVSQEKWRFGRFSSLPPMPHLPPPLRTANFITIVVSPSLTEGKNYEVGVLLTLQKHRKNESDLRVTQE